MQSFSSERKCQDLFPLPGFALQSFAVPPDISPYMQGKELLMGNRDSTGCESVFQN